jgi:hypothetical protein
MIPAQARILQDLPREQASRHRDGHDLRELGRWYRSLNLVCPLLAEQCCAWYATRPIACRQYFVITSPRHCGTGSNESRRLAMPFSIVQALCRLASDLTGSEPTAVLLPLAPAWAIANPGWGQRTWPSEQVFGRFVEIVQAMSSEEAETTLEPL